MEKSATPSELPFRAYKGNEPYLFVCYAHIDKSIVYSEMFWIHNEGFHIWYDEGITLTSEWPEEIENALLDCKLLLAFIIPEAIESKNVRKEINYALDNNKKVLPIFLKPTDLKHGLGLQLNSLQYIEKYKLNEEYYKQKVLEDLKKIGLLETNTELKNKEFKRMEEIARKEDKTALTLSASEKMQKIQLYYTKLINFIDRILQGKLIRNSMIINIAKDLSKTIEKDFFDISISFEGDYHNYITFEFLNGLYTLRIEVHTRNIDIFLVCEQEKLFIKQEEKIKTNNREKTLQFYVDLNDHIELTQGFRCKLPDNIEQEYKKLVQNNDLINEGINLIINLYKNRDSNSFAEKYRDSQELRSLFGVIIRNPTRDDITDEHFYFMNRKYYFIPNSAYLRIKNPEGHYDGYENYLTPNDPNQKKVDILSRLIQEIIEFIKSNQKFTPVFNLKSLITIFS